MKEGAKTVFGKRASQFVRYCISRDYGGRVKREKKKRKKWLWFLGKAGTAPIWQARGVLWV